MVELIVRIYFGKSTIEKVTKDKEAKFEEVENPCMKCRKLYIKR